MDLKRSIQRLGPTAPGFIWRGKFCWRATPALPAGPWVRVVKGIEGCRPEVNWGYMHLGSEPLGQFRYQSHKPPSVLISPEHRFDADRPADDTIPTVREMDAQRSRHASRKCHHAQLSIVVDRPYCTHHSFRVTWITLALAAGCHWNWCNG